MQPLSLEDVVAFVHIINLNGIASIDFCIFAVKPADENKALRNLERVYFIEVQHLVFAIIGNNNLVLRRLAFRIVGIIDNLGCPLGVLPLGKKRDRACAHRFTGDFNLGTWIVGCTSSASHGIPADKDFTRRRSQAFSRLNVRPAILCIVLAVGYRTLAAVSVIENLHARRAYEVRIEIEVVLHCLIHVEESQISIGALRCPSKELVSVRHRNIGNFVLVDSRDVFDLNSFHRISSTCRLIEINGMRRSSPLRIYGDIIRWHLLASEIIQSRSVRISIPALELVVIRYSGGTSWNYFSGFRNVSFILI